MGKDSSIQWCHSTLNLQAGCGGCELWNSRARKCYAGVKIDGEYAGRKGWPMRFNRPELFLDRLPEALRWKDPIGEEVPGKPWLKGYPRLIFLNDMGDTFTKELDLFWLAPLLPAMAASRHRFLLLTKRPSRAIEFSKRYPFPKNFWLGTSVTSNATKGRVEQLHQIAGGELKFVSFEPLWEEIHPSAYAGIQWAIFGGESGRGPGVTRTRMEWILNGARNAAAAGAKVFVKQLGSLPEFNHIPGNPGSVIPFPVKDSHGGDWGEWPAPLRIREMPPIPVHQPPTQQSLL